MGGIFDFLRDKARRRTTRQQTGQAAEKAAELYLKGGGYRIIARNVAYRRGEVDLVAQEKRSGTLCFVEVRSRTTDGGSRPDITPAQTVTPAKRRRVIAAARKFLADRRAAGLAVRFDVITVLFEGEDRRRPSISHLPGAFDSAGRPT